MIHDLTILFLTLLWNSFLKNFSPINYSKMTIGSKTFRENTGGDVEYLYIVRQVKLTCKSKYNILNRSVYQYEVMLVEVVNKNTVLSGHATLPEFSSFLFRNTSVPYVLALNAFKKLGSEKK